MGSLRKQPRNADPLVMPEWTRGDDSDNEVVAHPRSRLNIKRRNVLRPTEHGIRIDRRHGDDDEDVDGAASGDETSQESDAEEPKTIRHGYQGYEPSLVQTTLCPSATRPPSRLIAEHQLCPTVSKGPLRVV